MKNFKKSLAWVLILAMVITMIPVFTIVSSADGDKYLDVSVDESGVVTTHEQDIPSGATALTNQTTLSAGWYTVSGTVDINNRITCSGDVKIVLLNQCKLNATKGITVSGTNSLTIYAQSTGENAGQLIATAPDNLYSAGIGGYMYSTYKNCGTIIINGGIIEATGSTYKTPNYSGSGIGGSSLGSGGNITINGGVITANGGSGCAAIGGSYNASAGIITINDGNIVANGGQEGSGIGSGPSADSGEIHINGGTILAIGGLDRIGGCLTCQGIGHGDCNADPHTSNVILGPNVTGDNYDLEQGYDMDSLETITNLSSLAEGTLRCFSMKKPHVHSWTYSADETNKTITATCTGECKIAPPGSPLVVTLGASDSTYDGTANEATLIYGDVDESKPDTDWNSDNSLIMPVITYQKKNDDSTWGTETSTAPKDAGFYKATAKVTNDSDEYYVTIEYEISQADANLVVNTTELSGKDGDKARIDYSCDAKVKFTSSNEKIAVVDENGNVTFIASGEVTITVSVDDENYKPDSREVKVKIEKSAGSIVTEQLAVGLLVKTLKSLFVPLLGGLHWIEKPFFNFCNHIFFAKTGLFNWFW